MGAYSRGILSGPRKDGFRMEWHLVSDSDRSRRPAQPVAPKAVIKCPHCFFVSTLGVRVCRGCNAEVLYGPHFGMAFSGAIGMFILACGVVVVISIMYHVELHRMVFTRPNEYWPPFIVAGAFFFFVLWSSAKLPRFRKHF